jgi:hypothetical protein
MAKLNGTYDPDPGAKQRDGKSCPYKNEHGEGTIERSSGGRKGVYWHLNKDYGGDSYYVWGDAVRGPLRR